MKQVLNFLRRCVADCIGNIDRRRTRFDRGFDHAFKIIAFRADGIFGGKFDIIRIVPREFNHADSAANDLVLFHFQLKLTVKR